MAFTIRGTMTVHDLRVTLDDGRIVELSSYGDVHVYAGETDRNGYRIELPTVEHVAGTCLDLNGPGSCDKPVMVPVHHRY